MTQPAEGRRSPGEARVESPIGEASSDLLGLIRRSVATTERRSVATTERRSVATTERRSVATRPIRPVGPYRPIRP